MDAHARREKEMNGQRTDGRTDGTGITRRFTIALRSTKPTHSQLRFSSLLTPRNETRPRRRFPP